MQTLRQSGILAVFFAVAMSVVSIDRVPATISAAPQMHAAAMKRAHRPVPVKQILAAWHVGQSTALRLPLQAAKRGNQAAPARSWWTRANSSLTVQAFDLHGPIGDLKPRQGVVIDAIWTQPDKRAAAGSSSPVWRVNSPDAKVTSAQFALQTPSIGPLPRRSAISPWFHFTASKPGVYVVQASWDGTWSVPLVITVGASQLPSMPSIPSIPAQDAGVAPVAASALALDQTDTGLLWAANAAHPGLMRQMWVGQPVDGWLPLVGQVPRAWVRPGWAHAVSITLFNLVNGTNINYLLPIDSAGRFSGIVAIPYRGRVMLEVGPATDTASAAAVLSASRAQYGETWGGVIQSARTVTVNPELAAVASVDYQLPGFHGAVAEAARLWYNSPDPETGAVAISNWVATHIAYNYVEDRRITGTVDRWPVGATVGETWQAHSGVCENYAQVLTAMLRGLGIPAILQDGEVSSGWVSVWTTLKVETLHEDKQNHAWVVVKGVAQKPIVTDPTWDGGSPPRLSEAYFLTNNFTTATRLFLATHHPAGAEVSGSILP